MNKKNIILYHAKCRDGFGAAWAAWKKFKGTAEYIGLEHHLPLPEGLHGHTLYFLDYTPPESDMQKLLKNNERVVVIDHHVSQEKEAKMAAEFIYDVGHSAAVLAWRYFHPQKKLPRFLLYVEDGDLWNWKVPGSRELLLATEHVPQEFNQWNKLVRDVENPATRRKYIELGKAISGYEHTLIGRIMEDSEEVAFEGHRARAVNTSVIISQTGNAIVRKLGVRVAILWCKKGKKIIVSLRSDGTVDVSKLAKKYGGGGHRAAAGFSFAWGEPFPWR